jgi:hypothetical protein
LKFGDVYKDAIAGFIVMVMSKGFLGIETLVIVSDAERPENTTVSICDIIKKNHQPIPGPDRSVAFR